MTDFSAVDIRNVESFWDNRPCNFRHSTAPVGSREYFEEVEARKYFVEPHIPAFAEFARWKEKKVLEIGCGIGTDTINFARNGARVTAVELSQKSLDLAQRRAQVFGLQDRIRFIQGNAEELQNFLAAETFDLVYSFGVIHHSPHPERILKRIQDYLSAGGTLKIMVYNRLSWKALWILLRYGKGRFWRAKELIARYSEAQNGCPITYTYSPREMRRLLQKHGFRVLRLTKEHIFPFRIRDYVRYRYVRVWYFRFLPKRLFSWLEHRLGWHLCVTAAPAEAAPGPVEN